MLRISEAVPLGIRSLAISWSAMRNVAITAPPRWAIP